MHRYLVAGMFLSLSFSFAQFDLSTPGGESVLASFSSQPPGVEVYISDTYVGTTPTSARINAGTPTGIRLRATDGAYQDHTGTISLVTDQTINVTLQPIGLQPNPEQPAVVTPEPVPAPASQTVAQPASLASATTQVATTSASLASALAIVTLLALVFIVLYIRSLGRLRRFRPIRDLAAEREKLEQDIARAQAAAKQEVALGEEKKAQLEREAQDLITRINELKEELRPLDDGMDLIEHGLYQPLYDFDSLTKFEVALASVREKQKALIKDKSAVLWSTEWSVGGSRAKGKQMEGQYTRLMLRAFNGECDALISEVRYNNIHAIERRINQVFEAINKLGKTNQCELNPAYLQLKLEELHLVHEFREYKQEELEEQRRIREQLREEERARREYERAIIEAEKEEARYERALEKARVEAQLASGEQHARLEADIIRLQQLLAEAHANKERAKSQAELTRSGYVYIVSNVGSFGEDVYKIGMTRRLEPMDRVHELGDASVPFSFDVRAMVFSDDAPRLESALHRAFDHRRLNRINYRKEFFRVSLDEISAEARKHKADIHITLKAEAEEFRKTQALLAQESRKVSTVGLN